MAIDTQVAPHPVVAALARVEQAIAQARQAVWTLGDDDLVAALVSSERQAAQLGGLQLALIGEADARGVGGQLGAPDTAALLRHRLRISPEQAKARVRLASNPDLAATRAALCAGDITVGHAQVIGSAVRTLPAAVRAQAQAFLIGEAATFDTKQLHVLGKHIRHVVDPDTADREERAAARRRELSTRDQGDGTYQLRGLLGAEDHAALMAALDPLAAPTPAADGKPDPRTPAQRRADALMELVRRALDGADLPSRRGARPHLAITAGLDTLMRLAGAPAADTTWGGPLSAQTLRRIACDAGVSLVLLDSHGVPLDVGREHRTVTPGLWTALVARDRGCIFPGCTRPTAWTDAHHVTHWADGGHTALGNCVLLCGHHHRVVHHGGWDIAFADDGHPQLIPPAWIDPTRQPRRNTYWRIHDRLPPPDGP